MGGVETGAHALELIAAGASAVALGTVLFADPRAPGRVRDELRTEAARRGFDAPSAARGVAHAAVASTADAEATDAGRVGLKV
jgi:dihydroorotate dehydrogenase (NAD+) catalytic subunit